MSTSNQKFFKEHNDILVFIKGHKNCCGYCIVRGGVQKSPVIIENNLLVNSSEFFALNEAIKNIKNEGNQNNRRIKVYSNLEVITNFLKGGTKPDILESQYEQFKNATQGLFVSVHWVPGENSNTNKKSDLEEGEVKFAQQFIGDLSDKIEDKKKSIKKIIK